MGLLSGSVGAGLGGFFKGVAEPLQRREAWDHQWDKTKDWEKEKMDRLWGMELTKQEWAVEAAKGTRTFEATGKIIETLSDQYKSINSRLKGEPGFAPVDSGAERTALDKERGMIRSQIQALAATYLNLAGYDSAWTKELLMGMFDEDGSLTDEGNAVVDAAAKVTGKDTEAKGGLWSGLGELMGKWNEKVFEFWKGWPDSDKLATKIISDWESYKVSNGHSPQEPLTNEEAVQKLYGDAQKVMGEAWEPTLEKNKERIDKIKSSSRNLIEFIQEYLPKVREQVRAATTIPGAEAGAPQSIIEMMPQDSVTDQDLDAQLSAAEERGDFDVNERSLASGTGGFIGTPRGIISGGSIYPEGITQEELDAQNAIPRSDLNLGPAPSSARQYGETIGSDWIGSTQAVDALSEIGGPAADALSEWEVDRSSPPANAVDQKERLVKGIKDLIHKSESAANGYNAVAGSTKGDANLTSMTIGEIHKKYGDKAVGIGQFKRRFLLDNAKKYLNYDTKQLDAMTFDSVVQNMFLDFGIEDAGIDKYLDGDITIDEFHARLANIWRGLPPLRTSKKGDPSDTHGNITQIPGSELQDVLTITTE